MTFPVENAILALVVLNIVVSLGGMIVQRAQAEIPICISEMRNLSNNHPCGCWRSNNWRHADCPDGGGFFAYYAVLAGKTLGNCSTVELLPDNKTLGSSTCG